MQEDLPTGFEALSSSEFPDMEQFPGILLVGFPDVQIGGLTAFGKMAEPSDAYDAIIVSFIFYPLSETDIATFDDAVSDANLAMSIFGAAGSYEEVLSGEEPQVGNGSVYMCLAAGNAVIDTIISRRENIGQAVMVMHGGYQFDELTLAENTAEALDRHIQEILGETWKAEWKGNSAQPTPASLQLTNDATLVPTALPAIATPTTDVFSYSPSASLLSNTLVGKCKWDVRMSLSGFTPNSLITVSSSYSEVECATGKTVASSWTEVYSTRTNGSGNLVITCLHEGTGDYTYTFTDGGGNQTSLSFTTSP